MVKNEKLKEKSNNLKTFEPTKWNKKEEEYSENFFNVLFQVMSASLTLFGCVYLIVIKQTMSVEPHKEEEEEENCSKKLVFPFHFFIFIWKIQRLNK